MIGWLMRIPSLAWLLLTGVLSLIAIIEFLRLEGVSSTVISYGVQPALAVLLAGITLIATRQNHDRARHHWEKAAVIASIITVWFVLYFISGLFVTYVSNVLSNDPVGLLLNGLAFMVPAAALEYVRYKLMVLVSRRHAASWGAVVTVVFALYYINFTRLFTGSDAEAAVNMFFAEIVPALALSGLLTYLAIAAGLASVMVLRLGVITTTILPPVIPKYDWYLVGLSSLLLYMLVYLGIERYIQGRHRPEHHASQHLAGYQNAILIGTFAGLMMFMSGFFSYKPVAIVSNSMKPRYSRGSMVIIQRISSTVDIREGDIIQFEAKGVSITHRVKKVVESKSGGKQVFITQGDNSPSPDEPVKAEQVTGIVRSSAPAIGYPSVMLKEMMGK